MSSFTVTTAGTSVNLRPLSVKPGETAKGTASYTVTNRTGSTIRVRLRVEPDEGAEPGWFTVRDGDERDIPPGATANVSIDLAVPGGNVKRSFKLVVVNVADPDNDFEYGSTIAFDAPTIEKKESGLKWWMIAAPLALLVVVGGTIWGFSQLSKKEPVTVTLDNFVGTPLEKAKATLEAEGIAVVEHARSPTPQQPKFYKKVVVDQVPESDGVLEIPQDTQVKLGWEWNPKKVTVPTNLENSTLVKAIKAIDNAGLRFIGAIPPDGDRPSTLYYPAVASVSPTREQDAGTGITVKMKWRRGRSSPWSIEQVQELNQIMRLEKTGRLQHLEDILGRSP